MNEALHLIYVENEKFKVNEKVIKYISQIKEQVAIVSIAGIYRSGKSFLLNQLLDNENDNVG
jgi:predicted AAA+ superfamily ATPase